ncbi:MAG: glycosyltransferase family 2 protein [Deltaproteobacteria bacterium]|nr:glycosyltransferase family 2 protein [Deltaproteobacteria bacterium]
MKNHVEKYLARYAERGPWRLAASSWSGIHHAVVIPALAEYPAILETLHSLSRNAPEALRRTLVVCVVNNRARPHSTEEEIGNNGKTMALLEGLRRGETVEGNDPVQQRRIDGILNSPMRLAYVDASSDGLAFPEKAGVGTARKIGMDLALAVMEPDMNGRNLLLSLDADTRVEPDYLESVFRHFALNRTLAAVVPFSHEKSDDEAIRGAAAAYEAYLRYHGVGLKHAGSPYAFHAIGSTIVCSARAYAMVRGMPKRLAGEDFYFLNKLAKIRGIGSVEGTTVYPSPRLSARTPFGTGRKVDALIRDEGETHLFYDPAIFTIIRDWLGVMDSGSFTEGRDIMEAAGEIDGALPPFLEEVGFMSVWEKLKRNFPRRENLRRQFHNWFDGLATLRLAHHLTDHGYPRVAMHRAINGMAERTGRPLSGPPLSAGVCPEEALEIMMDMERALGAAGREKIFP